MFGGTVKVNTKNESIQIAGVPGLWRVANGAGLSGSEVLCGMERLLRAFAVLVGDPRSSFSTHVRLITTTSSSWGPTISAGAHIHVTYNHTLKMIYFHM